MTLEDAIEAFFLKDSKWELDIVPEGHPLSTPGRWLWLLDANYGFRTVDLANAIKAASPTCQQCGGILPFDGKRE